MATIKRMNIAELIRAILEVTTCNHPGVVVLKMRASSDWLFILMTHLLVY
jgi:hypothetical protein